MRLFKVTTTERKLDNPEIIHTFVSHVEIDEQWGPTNPRDFDWSGVLTDYTRAIDGRLTKMVFERIGRDFERGTEFEALFTTTVEETTP